ncbi:MAG: response regulator transcription factor [Bacteroidota bacterium]
MHQPSRSNGKILIIEDEALVRKALEFRLKRDGYETESATGMADGLFMMQTGTYDLIITDLVLHNRTGMDILNAAKKEGKTAVPVIILSAGGLETEVLEAFRNGADDYINKPFSPWELSMRVKRLIQQPAAA